jgi:uncharacterized membrane protein YbhN (UPF0104 family)
VRPALGELRWYSVLGSVAAAMAGAGCMMRAWRALLADLGSPLPVAVATRVTFVAQLGKYVPGAIWSFAAHVELGRDYGVPRRRGAASVIVALAVSIATGLLIAAVALPLASPDVLRRYALALAVAPVIAVCLAPPILHRLLNRALRIIRQDPLEQPVRWRGLAVAIGWNALGWLLYGTQVWLLLADVAKDGTRSMLLAIGAYALAFSLALLLVVVPNGIGARELLMVAALAPLLAHGPALAVALVVRVVTTVSDLAWGGIGVALGRTARVAALAASPASPAGPASLASPAPTRRQPGRHRKAPSRPWQRPRPAMEAADNAAAPAA